MDRELPKVGVGVMIRKGNQILLEQRKNSHGTGTWAFPGGHLEYGESWEECARREVLEEVGLHVGKVKFFTATNDIFENEGKHYVTIFVVAEYLDGDPQIMEPEKCTAVGWYTKDMLPDPLFLPLQNLLASGQDIFSDV